MRPRSQLLQFGDHIRILNHAEAVTRFHDLAAQIMQAHAASSSTNAPGAVELTLRMLDATHASRHETKLTHRSTMRPHGPELVGTTQRAHSVRMRAFPDRPAPPGAGRDIRDVTRERYG